MLPAFAMTGTNTQSDEQDVGAASTPFTHIITMAANETYMLTADCAICWMQGAAPVAVDGATSSFLPANTQQLIDGNMGAKLAVIAHGAVTGKAWLTRVKL